MLRAASVILRKDLTLRARDRSVWLFAFVVPLGLTFLFSTIFPEQGELELRGAVVDLDGGPVATGFVEEVLPSLVETGVLVDAEVLEEEAARTQLEDGDLDVAWVLPAGLSDAATQGQPARIDVLVAAGRTLPGEVARGVADAYARSIEQVALAIAVESSTGAPPDPGLLEAIAAAAAEQPELVTLVPEERGDGEPLDPVSYLAAGMAAFFVFFVVQYGITGMLEERDLGTLSRLQAAPIAPGAIQLAKVLGAFLLGLASVSVLAVASNVLLGARWGPPLGVAILLVALVLAAMGVMALVGQFARTAEQAGNYQSVVAVVLGLAGGVFVPVTSDAGVIRFLTAISPHGWFLRGMAELSVSGRWSVVLPAAAAIAAFGVAAAVPAVLLQRRRTAW
ncbi:MAG: ABC transporter permease [Nitriliruptoraceae bacterium]